MTNSREALKYLGLASLLLAWLLLNVIAILVPCIPFPTEEGEPISLSRLEHAWVVFAHPEWIWEQWTLGTSRVQLADRLPSLFQASFCIAIYTAAGYGIGRVFGLFRRSNRYPAQACLHSLLVGYCWCGSWITLLNWAFLDLSAMGAGGGLLISLLVPWFLKRVIPLPPCNETPVPTPTPWGEVSWQRRLTGLFLIATGILFLMQSIGSLVPSIDEEVRQKRWSSKLADDFIHQDREQTKKDRSLHWAGLEDTCSTWTLFRPFNEKRGVPGLEVQQLILNRYEPLIASKWIASIVWIASLILLTSHLNALYGFLVASMTTFFFAAFPCWMELIRLGRPEVISGAASIGILCVWMDALSNRSSLSSRNQWIATIFFAGPIAIGLASSVQFHPEGGYRWTEAALRVTGFSSLYSVPWVATCFLGCIVACTDRSLARRWICLSISLAVFAFAILGGVLAQPDRVWIPFGSFLILPFALGAERILKTRAGWIWFLVWSFAGTISLLNNAAQPGWDNRIFADLKSSIFERSAMESQTTTHSASQHRFAAEIQNQTVEGVLPMEGRVLLLGHWDCFDIPQRTYVQKVSMEYIASLTGEAIRDQGITHIALVDSAERGFVDWNDTLEHNYRIHFEKLEEEGVVTKLPVSDKSRDLTLFLVNP